MNDRDKARAMLAAIEKSICSALEPLVGKPTFEVTGADVEAGTLHATLTIPQAMLTDEQLKQLKPYITMRPEEREELLVWHKSQNHDCSTPIRTGDDVCSNETCYCCEMTVYAYSGPVPMVEQGPGWLCPVCLDRHKELDNGSR